MWKKIGFRIPLPLDPLTNTRTIGQRAALELPGTAMLLIKSLQLLMDLV